jgi:hypothetical protein
MMSKRLFRQHAYTIETTSRAREIRAWVALAVVASVAAFACTPAHEAPEDESDPDEISMRAFEAGRMAEIDQSQLRAAQSYRQGWEDALRARAAEDALRAQGGR